MYNVQCTLITSMIPTVLLYEVMQEFYHQQLLKALQVFAAMGLGVGARGVGLSQLGEPWEGLED